MNSTPARLILTIALTSGFAVATAVHARQGEEPQPAVVPDAELLDELKGAAEENPDRESKLLELYLQAGAKPDEVRVQEVPAEAATTPPLHNVIATLKGETDDVIVVGGHLDKVSVGRGVID